jgi:hypothetical protein
MGHITPKTTFENRFFTMYLANCFTPEECEKIIKSKMRISEVKHKVSQVVKRINKVANWEYPLDGKIEMEVVDYTWEYNWPDMNKIDEQEDGSRRQLTCYINLTHPDDYDYADLWVRHLVGSSEQGLANIFPSFQQNSVSKATKGFRYALVVWFYGKGGRGIPNNKIYNVEASV